MHAINTLHKNWLLSSIFSPYGRDKTEGADCENPFQQPARARRVPCPPRCKASVLNRKIPCPNRNPTWPWSRMLANSRKLAKASSWRPRRKRPAIKGKAVARHRNEACTCVVDDRLVYFKKEQLKCLKRMVVPNAVRKVCLRRTTA